LRPSGLGISGGFAFAFQEILAIRTRACNIDFYVDQNALGEDGLVTRFSFRVEPDNSLMAAFFTQFSQQYERVAARAFQNYDDEDLVRVPVLDWSEQITFRV
jgi:hypothetical protein